VFTAAADTAAPPPPPPPPPQPAQEHEPEQRVERPSRRRPRDDYDDEPDDDDYDDRPRRRPRRDLAPHRGTAVLILGILSLVVLPIIFGPIAWIMANNDLREMRAGRMDRSGESNTNAGRICGIIGTVMGGIGLCCCGAWFIMVLGAGAQGGFH
jgi:hypothetical protein